MPSYSKMLMAAEPASEFNEQGSSNLNITQVHRFRSGEVNLPPCRRGGDAWPRSSTGRLI